jgi:hypothetical protein
MKRFIAMMISAAAIVGCGAPAAGPTPVLGVHHVPSLTRERYEAVVRQLTGGRDRLKSVTDGGIKGLLLHVAAEGDDGFWVIDVWESQDAVDRFGQRIAPVAKAAGIKEPMRRYSIHTFLTR